MGAQEDIYIVYKGKWEKKRITRSRQEEIVLTRIRLGHTKLNSTMFLIKKHDGNCIAR